MLFKVAPSSASCMAGIVFQLRKYQGSRAHPFSKVTSLGSMMQLISSRKEVDLRIIWDNNNDRNMVSIRYLSLANHEVRYNGNVNGTDIYPPLPPHPKS